MNNFINYIKLMRVKHWLKNILIFLPCIFAGVFFEKNNLITLALGFLCFSLIASCVYLFNDIKDIEKDKKHSKKKKRPLPSGAISIKNAIKCLIILLFLSAILIVIVTFKTKNILMIAIPLIYLVVNILYSIKLKEYPIIDVLILAFDYLIRLIYGAFLTGIVISNWLYLVVMFVSLFMGFGKRKKELEEGKGTRKVLKEYNSTFLNNSMNLCMTCAIVFYSLWTINALSSSGEKYSLLKYSVPIVIIIILLYNYLIEKDNNDGDPIEVLLSSKLLMLLSIIYILFMLCILYIV